MSRNRINAGRYFMSAILSALIHAVTILAVLIVWSSIGSETDGPDSNSKLSSNPRIFWQPKTDLQVVNRIAPIKEELAPITAHLIPIAMVHPGNKLSNPIQSMNKDLQISNVSGLQINSISIPQMQKSNIILPCLRIESVEERVGILIDRSLSMGLGGAWDQVLHEFDAFLPNISSEVRSRIWLFDKTTEEIARSDDWGTWNQARIRQALHQVHETRPGGPTDLANAVRTVALRGSTRIVVISDDADLSINDWLSIGSTLRRLGKSTPRVCAIRLGQYIPNNDKLAEICRQSGGWCRQINQD